MRRARSLYANNATARAGVDSIVAAIVCSGIKLRSTVSDPRLAEAISTAFERWTDSADADDLTDFYGLQSLVATHMIRDGESFVALLPGLNGRLQLRVIDPDQVDVSVTRDLGDGRFILQGVEFYNGNVVAHHIRRDVIGLPIALRIETVRVPADAILHIFRRDTAGQVRGLSWLAPVLLRLNDLDDALDAQLVRQKVAAMVVGIITEPNGEAAGFTGEAEHDGVIDAGLEPGTLRVLAPGQDITFNGAAPVGSEVIEFLNVTLREIASALGMPAFILTGNLSDANFGSLRVGLVEFRRRVEAWQHSIIAYQLLRPVWRRWLIGKVISGRLSIPGFFRDPEAFLSMKAIPPKNQWLDPLKDVKAEIAAIDAGLQSRREAVASRGYDIEDVDREIAADATRAKALSLDLSGRPKSGETA